MLGNSQERRRRDEPWLFVHLSVTIAVVIQIGKYVRGVHVVTVEKVGLRERGLHNWEHACNTPSGGLAGDDPVYVCTQCGMETLSPQYKKGCKNPNRNVACPKCSPHPKHPSGKCRFVCSCEEDNEDLYGGAMPW